MNEPAKEWSLLQRGLELAIAQTQRVEDELQQLRVSILSNDTPANVWKAADDHMDALASMVARIKDRHERSM